MVVLLNCICLDSARPCHGENPKYTGLDGWQEILFYEYFHPETGRGLGASHQTGWTGLIAECIDLLNTPEDFLTSLELDI
eukprot:m.89210 g.89210  ORF g.89210 m.89210 type:complete len:80 (-) comp13209_c0_seq2:102-341(-)